MQAQWNHAPCKVLQFVTTVLSLKKQPQTGGQSGQEQEKAWYTSTWSDNAAAQFRSAVKKAHQYWDQVLSKNWRNKWPLSHFNKQKSKTNNNLSIYSLINLRGACCAFPFINLWPLIQRRNAREENVFCSAFSLSVHKRNNQSYTELKGWYCSILRTIIS